ncbi:MAG TPA: chromate resistance protein ChrB domain-containing protein [Rhizomicrobium sp.]|nr:chromate resistance protein ChrB domain-containing protein [Rhizomicrobium sp.]
MATVSPEASNRLNEIFPCGGASRWITRERPKIDRIACPWLVLRFVDPSAEFLFVPANEVLSRSREVGAEPFDIPGVRFSHRGERCSFDAFLKEFALEADTALAHLATIVRGADTAALDLAPEAPGLLAVSLGLSQIYSDDQEMLRAGMVVYDALYAWALGAQGERHGWPPTMS